MAVSKRQSSSFFLGMRSNSRRTSPSASLASRCAPISSLGILEGLEKGAAATRLSASRSGRDLVRPCSVARKPPPPLEDEDASRLSTLLPLSDLIDLRLPVLLPKLSAQRLRPARGLELGVRGACALWFSEVGVANGWSCRNCFRFAEGVMAAESDEMGLANLLTCLGAVQ